MPSQIVIACDEAAFTEDAAAALRNGGHSVIVFHDSLKALDAMEAAQSLELLVTGIEFGRGQLNGLALARMARHKRPSVRVLFLGKPEHQPHTAGLGEFMTLSAAVEDVVRRAEQLLQTRDAARDRDPPPAVRRWRNKAEELRVNAERMPHSVSRGTLLRVAETYDRLANEEEQRLGLMTNKPRSDAS